MNNSISEVLYSVASNIIDSIDFDKMIHQNEFAMKTIVKNIIPILNDIKDSTKILAKRSLELGFYPSNNFNLYNSEFISLQSEKEEVEYLCSKIDQLLSNNYLIEISNYFDKKQILKCYKLYNQKDYESCILNLIVIINQIFIIEFGCCSEEINRLYDEINCKTSVLNMKIETKCLSRKQAYDDRHKDNLILKHKMFAFEDNAYYIFAPYYNYLKDNTLFKSCNSNKEEYEKVPYNRNAIIHGFVDNYGNRENCLRWFSVIINTYELVILYRKMIELKNDAKEGNL